MFKCQLVKNEFLCKEAQLFLAEHGNEYIREVLTYNVSVNIDTMRILANDSCHWVRSAVYRNSWRFPELWRHNV